MCSVVSPRDVIDAFKRNHRELSAEDMQFLDRLRSERFASEAATAWRYIRTADARAIECAVQALRVAKALPKLPAAADKRECDLKKAKECVRFLHGYFGGYQEAELRRGLAQIEKFFEPVEDEGIDVRFTGWLTEAEVTVGLNSLSGKIPRLSRKYKTPAAQRRAFMIQVGQAMRTIFRRPCDAAVAALTTVAFEVDVSIDDMRNAWDWSIRRKG
jgi:hypothetical protein